MEIKPIQARFQQLRNDLFWEIFDRAENKFIKWSGYNDNFWWSEVARSDNFQLRGEYRLNPFTNEVTIEITKKDTKS